MAGARRAHAFSSEIADFAPWGIAGWADPPTIPRINPISMIIRMSISPAEG
jgi:hypothetical protein